MNTRIVSTGSYVPDNKVSNDDLSKRIDTSDEWISSRTGIKNRHVSIDECTSDLAVGAAKNALKNSDIEPKDIDAIIVATSSGDYAFPNTASLVQSKIGADNAFCFDISAACTGFIYALSIAEAYIKSSMCRNILIIGCEKMSREVDWKDRSVCVLFGDGAGAVLMSADGSDDTFDNVFILHSEGSKGEVLTCGARELLTSGNKSPVHMDGQEVFKFAVKKVPESIIEVLEKASLDISEVGCFVLHQANSRIIESVAKRLKTDINKFPMNLSEYGNTSAASIPILLDELNRSNRLKKGEYIVLSGFGAGLSWGSILLRW